MSATVVAYHDALRPDKSGWWDITSDQRLSLSQAIELGVRDAIGKHLRLLREVTNDAEELIFLVQHSGPMSDARREAVIKRGTDLVFAIYRLKDDVYELNGFGTKVSPKARRVAQELAMLVHDLGALDL